jgi:hypothetical protein
MNPDQLASENETLHCLLADACATLMAYAATELGQAAADCLERIAKGEPADPYQEGMSPAGNQRSDCAQSSDRQPASQHEPPAAHQQDD